MDLWYLPNVFYWFTLLCPAFHPVRANQFGIYESNFRHLEQLHRLGYKSDISWKIKRGDRGKFTERYKIFRKILIVTPNSSDKLIELAHYIYKLSDKLPLYFYGVTRGSPCGSTPHTNVCHCVVLVDGVVLYWVL